LRAGRDLDFVGEPADDLSERPDFILAEAARDHQVGGMPQCPRAALGRSPGHCFLKVIEKRRRLAFPHRLELKAHLGGPKPLGERSSVAENTGFAQVFGKDGREVLSINIR
jgi:hypothetical protein